MWDGGAAQLKILLPLSRTDPIARSVSGPMVATRRSDVAGSSMLQAGPRSRRSHAALGDEQPTGLLPSTYALRWVIRSTITLSMTTAVN